MSKSVGIRTLHEREFAAFVAAQAPIVKKTPGLTQSYEELRERGNNATARSRDLVQQVATTAKRSQDLRDWLYTVHQHRP